MIFWFFIILMVLIHWLKTFPEQNNTRIAGFGTNTAKAIKKIT